MTFGVGIGDVVVVSTLAWKVYKSCKESSVEFKHMSADLMSLHAVLRETEDYLQEHSDLDKSRINRLQILCDGCREPLDELQALVDKYESLGTQAQRTWDRMRFGLKDVSDLRSRIVCSTTLLNAFNIALMNSSTRRIEQRLTKFMAEVQAGLREGSVVTTEDVTETIESPKVWTEFRRELEDVGISASVVEENRQYIAAWIKDALVGGLLDESAPNPDSAGVDRRPSVMSYRSSSSNISEIPPSIFSDSGYGGSSDSRRPSTVSISTANEEFERQLEKQRSSSVVSASTVPPITRTYTLKPKKRMDVGRLLQRIMVKDNAIIMAASEGNPQRVSDLLSLGVDCNAKDRWGWSALSMCAYGGHKEIARMLLDHGANLDNIDVDGDTPTSLAAQRGHTDLVVMFDEERAARDLRLREADTETPRRVEI